MKNKFILIAALVLGCGVASAQSEKSDAKTGWNFGPFPAVGYSTDLGFQYGAFAEIYDFGDGTIYPDYFQSFSVEASAYTKGSAVFSFGYDSEHLLPNIRTTFTISYLPDSMMPFYGFNGYMSPYDSSQGASFYCMDRKYFRTYLDLQGKIVGDLKWAAGLGYYSYEVAPVKLDAYVDMPNLLSLYLDEGIITSDELAGKHLEFRAGLTHDTRDSEADPYRGVFTELMVVGSPTLFEGGDESFAQLSLSHRGYIPVIGDRLTFAYRLFCQSTIAGEVPFYHLQNLTTLLLRQTYSEGVGGNVSLRGVLRNRAVGAGYFLSNVEMRYRFLDFDFIGQHWYLAFNPFFDMGQVVQPYRADMVQGSTSELIYSGAEESMHYSAGAGCKIVMNRNFILSAEFGKALDAQDGTNSLVLGLNFLF